MKQKKGKKKVLPCQVYLDPEKGLVFVTEDKRKHAYKVYRNASGAIEELSLEEI